MSSYKVIKAEMNDHEKCYHCLNENENFYRYPFSQRLIAALIGFMNEYFVPDEPINAAINLCEK